MSVPCPRKGDNGDILYVGSPGKLSHHYFQQWRGLGYFIYRTLLSHWDKDRV